MSDFVAQDVDVSPTKGMQTLSGLLSLKQRQQTLQTGQYKQQQEQLETQKQQGVQDFFNTWDPTDHIGSDGTTDLDSALQSREFKAAGNAKPAVMQALLDIKNKQLAGKSTLASLNGALVTQFGTGVGALAKDEDVVADKTDSATGVNAGRAKVDQFISNFSKLSPDAARIAQIYGPITQHAPPGKLSTGIQAMQLQAQSASEQQAQQNPAQLAVNTGAATNVYNVNRASGLQSGQQPAQTIANAPPPGFDVVTDPRTQNPYLINRQSGEMRDLGYGYPGKQPGGSAPPQQAPGARPASMPQPYYPGQGQDTEDFRKEVGGVRAAGDQAPTARNINQQILRLADNAKTGPGTEIWQHAVGALTAPFGLSPTASYQELGKFLEKNAISNMQSMGGPPSDARLSAAAAANGSTSFSPEALKAVTKFNDATNTALIQYRQGVDHAVGMGQNVDYTKLPAFKAAWAKNFDVDVFRVENAIRDGDKAELAKIKSELGPERLKALAEKRKNLQLLTQGQIP